MELAEENEHAYPIYCDSDLNQFSDGTEIWEQSWWIEGIVTKEDKLMILLFLIISNGVIFVTFFADNIMYFGFHSSF